MEVDIIGGTKTECEIYLEVAKRYFPDYESRVLPDYVEGQYRLWMSGGAPNDLHVANRPVWIGGALAMALKYEQAKAQEVSAIPQEWEAIFVSTKETCEKALEVAGYHFPDYQLRIAPTDDKDFISKGYYQLEIFGRGKDDRIYSQREFALFKALDQIHQYALIVKDGVITLPIGGTFKLEGYNSTFEAIKPFDGTVYFVQHIREGGAADLYGPVPGRGFKSADEAKAEAARISPERRGK